MERRREIEEDDSAEDGREEEEKEGEMPTTDYYLEATTGWGRGDDC